MKTNCDFCGSPIEDKQKEGEQGRGTISLSVEVPSKEGPYDQSIGFVYCIPCWRGIVFPLTDIMGKAAQERIANVKAKLKETNGA